MVKWMNKVVMSALLIGLCVCDASLIVDASQTELIASESQEEDLGTIKLEYAAALTGDETKPCRIVFYQPTGGGTCRDAKPGRLVVYSSSENQEEAILWQCYRDDIFLEKADLLQYYWVTKIEFADVDDDNIDEAVISWDSDCMGSGWIQTLEVLDYDLATKEFRSYKGVTASGPFGGFKVDSLDPAGNVQRIFAYSYKSDGMDTYTGTECRWCPHRYRVAVYAIADEDLVVDPHWNSGQIAYTQLRFPCDGSGNPTDEYRSLNDYYMRSSLYNALDAGPPFVVLSPQPNQTVSLPFSLRVEIPQDMTKLGIQVLSDGSDGREKLLLEDIIDGWAHEPSTSLKVEDSIYYAAPLSSRGKIVLYDPDDPTRTFSIPIVFEPVETVTVWVYFPNKQMEADSLVNEPVFPVERTISRTESQEEAALIQLFRGPTGPEKETGFFTYLVPPCKAQNFFYVEHPCSEKLKRLAIEDGIAQVWIYDIDWLRVIYRLGGVRGVETTLRQIRQTLLQFPNVSQVVIW